MEEKLIDKKISKKSAEKCRVCKESDYNVLDVHRIIPGSEEGRYTKSNSCVLCSNCHRKVHAGEIIIDRYYESTSGRVLRVIIDGKEDFI